MMEKISRNGKFYYLSWKKWKQIIMSLVSDIFKGYWTYQPGWNEVPLSLYESSLYGEDPAASVKFAAANQIRGTNWNITASFILILIVHLLLHLRDFWLSSEWTYVTFCVNSNPFSGFLILNHGFTTAAAILALFRLAAHWTCIFE